MSYFSCRNDVNDEECWFLSEPVYQESGSEVPDVFQSVRTFNPRGGIRLSVTREGAPSHFSTYAMDVPVASSEFARVLSKLCPSDIGLLPVMIDGLEQGYCIVNVLKSIDCLSESETDYFRVWGHEDGRDDKIGDYRDVFGLALDRSRIPSDIHIFRPARWLGALIISDTFKTALDELGNRGVELESVTD